MGLDTKKTIFPNKIAWIMEAVAILKWIKNQ